MSIDSPSPNDTTHRPLAAFCILVGMGAMWVSRTYDTGTVISMGPGFFPKAVAGLLIVLGLAILVVGGRDLEAAEDDGPAIRVPSLARILLCVIGSVVLFGLTLKPFGLPVATFLMVTLASIGRRGARPVPVIVTAVLLSVLATLLFAFALQLQIPVYPEFLK